MAKRRILKRNISYVAGELFTEEKTDKLLTRILDMQDEFIRRAQRPDGNGNKALVKEYYKKLIVDLQTEINSITDELDQLNKHE